jgi:hypothetical protein
MQRHMPTPTGPNPVSVNFDRDALQTCPIFTKLHKYIISALDEVDPELPGLRWSGLLKMLTKPDEPKKLFVSQESLLWRMCLLFTQYASKVDPNKHAKLIDILLTFDCRCHLETLYSWLSFLIALCTSSITWVSKVFHSLCRILTNAHSLELFRNDHAKSLSLLFTNNNDDKNINSLQPTTMVEHSILYDPNNTSPDFITTLDQLHTPIHLSIGKLLNLIPMSSGHAISAFQDTSPHYTAPVLNQCLWVHSVLRACELQPILRDSLLTSVVEKILSLDVHLNRKLDKALPLIQRSHTSHALQLLSTSSSNVVITSGINEQFANHNDGSAGEDDDYHNDPNNFINFHFGTNPDQTNAPNEEIQPPKRKTNSRQSTSPTSPTSTTSSTIENTGVLINGIVTPDTDPMFLIDLSKAKINEPCLNQLLFENKELVSIDGLLSILLRYFYLVAHTPDKIEAYIDPLLLRENNIKIEQFEKHLSKNNAPSSPSLIKSEIKLEIGQIQPDPINIIPPSSSRRKNRASQKINPENLTQDDRNLLSIMNSSHTGAQPKKDNLPIPAAPNTPQNTQQTTLSSSGSDKPDSITPPQLRQTVSERVLHDTELSFELDAALTTTRLQNTMCDDDQYESGANSPVLTVQTAHEAVFDGRDPSLQLVKVSKLNDDVFGSIFRTFNRSILPTTRPHFVQWLLFYQCSNRFEYMEVLLRLLKDRLFSIRSNNNIRISCIIYTGSLLVRAKSLRATSAATAFTHLAEYAHSYIDNFLTQVITQSNQNAGNQGSSGQSGSVMSTDSYGNNTQSQLSPDSHVVFYVLVETLLYVATLRPDLVRHVRPLQLSVPATVARSVNNNNNNNNNNNKRQSTKGLLNQSSQIASSYQHHANSKIGQRRSMIGGDLSYIPPLDATTMNVTQSAQSSILGSMKPLTSNTQSSSSFGPKTSPFADLSNELSPVLSPLLSAHNGINMPLLNITQASHNNTTSSGLTMSSSLENGLGLNDSTGSLTLLKSLQTDLISKHSKPIIVETKHIILNHNFHDPLHLIWLLTSVFRPTQFLSPLLLERYMLLYHNTIAVSMLFDLNNAMNSHAYQTPANVATHSAGMGIYGHHNASNAYSRGRELEHVLNSLGQTSNRLTPLLLPTVWIHGINQSVNLTTLVSTNSASIRSTQALLRQLTPAQSELLAVYVKQQLQAYKSSHINSIVPFLNNSVQKNQKFNEIFDSIQLSATNPLITLPDLQQAGIYPLLHPKSPLIQHSRKESTSYQPPNPNKKPTTGTKTQAKTVAERDMEVVKSQIEMKPEDYQIGLTALQTTLSFLEFPFDPFYSISVRDSIMQRYSLTFDTYQSQARYYNLYRENLAKKFTPFRQGDKSSQSSTTNNRSSVFSSILNPSHQSQLPYIKLGDVPTTTDFITSLTKRRSTTSLSSRLPSQKVQSTSLFSLSNNNNKGTSPFTSPSLKPQASHGQTVNAINGFVPLPLFATGSPTLAAISTSMVTPVAPLPSLPSVGKSTEATFGTMFSTTNTHSNNDNNSPASRRSTIMSDYSYPTGVSDSYPGSSADTPNRKKRFRDIIIGGQPLASKPQSASKPSSSVKINTTSIATTSNAVKTAEKKNGRRLTTDGVDGVDGGSALPSSMAKAVKPSVSTDTMNTIIELDEDLFDDDFDLDKDCGGKKQQNDVVSVEKGNQEARKRSKKGRNRKTIDGVEKGSSAGQKEVDTDQIKNNNHVQPTPIQPIPAPTESQPLQQPQPPSASTNPIKKRKRNSMENQQDQPVFAHIEPKIDNNNGNNNHNHNNNTKNEQVGKTPAKHPNPLIGKTPAKEQPKQLTNQSSHGNPTHHNQQQINEGQNKPQTTEIQPKKPEQKNAKNETNKILPLPPQVQQNLPPIIQLATGIDTPKRRKKARRNTTVGDDQLVVQLPPPKTD